MGSRKFVFGHCGNDVASDKGYRGMDGQLTRTIAHIYICHRCMNSTYFSPEGKQTPGSSFGGAVSNIPYEEVEALYNEARACMKVSAFTAVAMCCRNLLMNVAVDQGADKNKSFAHYVTILLSRATYLQTVRSGPIILGTKATKRITRYRTWAKRTPKS